MPDDFPARVDVKNRYALLHELKNCLRRELSISTDNDAVNRTNRQASEDFGIFFDDDARSDFVRRTARRQEIQHAQNFSPHTTRKPFSSSSGFVESRKFFSQDLQRGAIKTELPFE